MMTEIGPKTYLLKKRAIVMSNIINNIKNLMSTLMLDKCSLLTIADIRSLTDITYTRCNRRENKKFR